MWFGGLITTFCSNLANNRGSGFELMFTPSVLVASLIILFSIIGIVFL